MSIDAMKQALAALDVATTPLRKDRITVLEAKEALRAAIEAAEQQEPVAIGCEPTDGKSGPVIWLNHHPKPGELLYTTPQPTIPDGMVLVPVEPTNTQVRAGQLGVTTTCAKAIYKAMVAAAPKPGEKE